MNSRRQGMFIGLFATAVLILTGVGANAQPAGFVQVNSAFPFVHDLVTVGDFNEDGQPDVAAINSGMASRVVRGAYNGILYTMHGDGRGGFAEGPIIVFGFPPEGHGEPTDALKLFTADFDGDHHLDLAWLVKRGTEAYVVVTYGLGDGRFSMPIYVGVGPALDMDLAYSDLDPTVRGSLRPRVPILAVLTQRHRNLYRAWGDADGYILSNYFDGSRRFGAHGVTFDNVPALGPDNIPELAPFPRTLRAADMDGDGIPELIMTAHYRSDSGLGSPFAFVYRARRYLDYESVPAISLPLSGVVSDINVVDLNRDGLADIVVAEIVREPVNSVVEVFFATRGPRIAAPGPSATTPGFPNKITPIDLDGTGNMEILLGAVSRGIRQWVRMNVTALSLAVTPFPIGPLPLIAVADLNGDRRTDILGLNHPLLNGLSNAVSFLNRPPDLSISKSSSPYFDANGTGTYTISVTNTGFSATGLGGKVMDNLPAGLSVTRIHALGADCRVTSWAAASENVVCDLRGLLPGERADIVITVSIGPKTPDQIVNTARVDYPGEPNLLDNAASVATEVRRVHLAMFKTHEGTFVVGRQGRYMLSVINRGRLAADGASITVEDFLPPGLRFVSGPGCAMRGERLVCRITGPIAPDGRVDIPLTVAVDFAAVPLVTNTARVQYKLELDTADNTATDPTRVRVDAILGIAALQTLISDSVVQKNVRDKLLPPLQEVRSALLKGDRDTATAQLKAEYALIPELKLDKDTADSIRKAIELIITAIWEPGQ